MKLLFIFCLLHAFVTLSYSWNSMEQFQVEEEKDPNFWREKATQERLRIMNQKPNFNKAKNVIMFLGDGMTTTTVTAGRILKGQLQDRNGEATVLSVDHMPYSGFSKTYCTDAQVADSACTATAYLSGVKTNAGMMGVDSRQPRAKCNGSSNYETESFLIQGNKGGRAAGIVTTTEVTHATPGTAYAHTSERGWYSDADLTDEAKKNGCKDIASQFIDSSHHFDVVLGGGRRNFLPKTVTDPVAKKPCKRQDSRDLVKEWKQLRDAENKTSNYVSNPQELAEVDSATTDSLLGLFNYKHLEYDYNRKTHPEIYNEPSLADMTRKAIEILSKNTSGYTLLVEGGRIDHAHHAGQAGLALYEMVAFDEAIQTALNMTSADDTLIVVTADHGHTMAMGGYSVRGNPILGLAPDQKNPSLALDGKPYTTLLYANGPGYKLNNTNITGCNHVREDLTHQKTKDKPQYRQQAAVPLPSESHGGEDVGVYARGPYSHLLTGVFEQSYIAHVIMYAACIGNDSGCMEEANTSVNTPTSGPSTVNVLGHQISHAGVSHLLGFFIAMTTLLLVSLVVIVTYMYVRMRQSGVHIMGKP